MEEKHPRVDSRFNDELEMLATSSKTVSITFWNQAGKAVIHGQIEEVNTDGDNGFIKMNSGLIIGLNKLINVNGMPASGYC